MKTHVTGSLQVTQHPLCSQEMKEEEGRGKESEGW